MRVEDSHEVSLARQFIRMPSGKKLRLKPFEDTVADLRQGVKPEEALQQIPDGYEALGHTTKTTLALYFPMRACQGDSHDARQCDFLCKGESHPKGLAFADYRWIISSPDLDSNHTAGPVCRFCKSKPGYPATNTTALTLYVAYEHLAKCKALKGREDDAQRLQAAIMRLYGASIDLSKRRTEKSNLTKKNKRVSMLQKAWKTPTSEDFVERSPTGVESGSDTEAELPSPPARKKRERLLPIKDMVTSSHTSGTSVIKATLPSAHKSAITAHSSQHRKNRKLAVTTAADSDDSYVDSDASLSSSVLSIHASSTSGSSSAASEGGGESPRTVLAKKGGRPPALLTSPRSRSSRVEVVIPVKRPLLTHKARKTTRPEPAGSEPFTVRRVTASTQPSAALLSVFGDDSSASEGHLAATPRLNRSLSKAKAAGGEPSGQQQWQNLRTKSSSALSRSSGCILAGQAVTKPKIIVIDDSSDDEMAVDEKPPLQLHVKDEGPQIADHGVHLQRNLQPLFRSPSVKTEGGAQEASLPIDWTVFPRAATTEEAYRSGSHVSIESSSSSASDRRDGQSAGHKIGTGACEDSDADDATMDSDVDDEMEEEEAETSVLTEAEHEAIRQTARRAAREDLERMLQAGHVGNTRRDRMTEGVASTGIREPDPAANLEDAAELEQSPLKRSERLDKGKGKRVASDADDTDHSKSIRRKTKAEKAAERLSQTATASKAVPTAIVIPQDEVPKVRKNKERPPELPSAQGNTDQSQVTGADVVNDHPQEPARSQLKDQVRIPAPVEAVLPAAAPVRVTNVTNAERASPTANDAPKPQHAKYWLPLELLKFHWTLRRGGVTNTAKVYSTFATANSAKRFLDFELEAHPHLKFTSAMKTEFVDTIEAFIRNRPAPSAAGP